MKREVAFAIVVALFLCSIENAGNATGPTMLSLNPYNTRAWIFHSFTLNLSISSVTDLYLWVATIQWNSTVLSLTKNPEQGPFLKQGGQTAFMTGKILPGKVEGLTCSLLGSIPGVSGNGTLATFQFNSTNTGTTTIEIAFSDLLNSNGESISHSRINSTVTVVIPSHDVSIVDVEPLKGIVGQNQTLSISVLVQNEGDYAETFNVTTSANAIIVASQNITRPAGNSSVATLVWDTTGFAYGNYTVSAYAWPVLGETETADNTFVDGKILVTITGDINGDQFVNAKDAIILGVAFSSKRGEVRYTPNADLNGDDWCNAKDAIIIGKNFGQSWT